MMFGSVYAEQTTPNLINNVRGTSGYNVWLGTGAAANLGGLHPINVYGCCTSVSGSNPLLDTSTANGNGESGQIIWSYGTASVYHIIAINQALSGTGIQINGYNWSYDLRNMNGDDRQGSVDTLTAYSRLYNAAGNSVLLQQSRTHNTKMEWTNFSSTVTAPNPYSLANVGFLQLQFTSADSGFWGGYYGPQIRNIQASLNYTVQAIDPCTQDPLSSPSCPGYQQAYHDQQCSINPLYAVSCPGYQQAYYNQQCSINPLYDSNCPGYQQAYFNQQCTNDPLYNNQCPGYAQAYFDQQCSLDPLYNNQCPGYQQAYFNQQCSLNGLYDRTCPNYAQAYATQQLLNSPNTTTQTTVQTTTTEPVVQVNDDGKVSTDIPLVSDPVVNSVLTKNTESKKEDKKEEKKETVAVEKPKSSTTKQAAAPPKVDPATQTQSEKDFEQTVATQTAAVNAISFVPGFSAYQNAIIPDTNALTMQRQYNKPTVDNARAMRQLNGASDRLHNEMVQQQYR